MRRCPGYECSVQIPDQHLCCHMHWRELPRDLMERIWHAHALRRTDPDKHRELVMEAVRFLRAIPETTAEASDE